MQPAQGNPSTESSSGQSNLFGAQFECLDPLAENESRIQFKQGVLRDYGLVWVKQGELHGTQQNHGIFLTFCVLWKTTLTLPDKLPQSSLTLVACSVSLLRVLVHGLPLSFVTTSMYIMLNKKKRGWWYSVHLFSFDLAHSEHCVSVSARQQEWLFYENLHC